MVSPETFPPPPTPVALNSDGPFLMDSLCVRVTAPSGCTLFILVHVEHSV